MDSSNGMTDWNDMNFFNPSHFDDGNSAFDDFTIIGDAGFDSSNGLPLRASVKASHDATSVPGAHISQDVHMQAAVSAESSSQDSSSDTSTKRKRKTQLSGSPTAASVNQTARSDAQIKQEDVKMPTGALQHLRSLDTNFARHMHNPSLDQSLGCSDTTMGQFEFNSTASSPIQAGDFNSAMSLDAHVLPASRVSTQFTQDSPIQTINPGMFAIGSRDQSPSTTNMIMHQASPNAIFSTPSSDSQDTFTANQNWNSASFIQNAAWPGDFSNNLASPGSLTYPPSPGTNGAPPTLTSRSRSTTFGRSPLHIAPISTKSRVETQINVVMTLEKPPPNTEQLHLPLHTIAKSKLLAKEEFEQSKTLELHTMLVCSSAMHTPQFRKKALQQAAAANNEEIQRRAELARESGDEEKNDPKNVEEEDKPANGGEVRICSNCIQRERKRAGRKKTKREEEQAHWERFETERIVVFNSNEYLPFKPPEHGGSQMSRDGSEGDQYLPPEGSLQVAAAMRIACYCRHQSEKEGFRVIFTLKDHNGQVVAQQMSDSILITDDHKTHPQSFSTPTAGETFYQNQSYVPNGLSMSHSMVDMTTHTQPFTSSRSAGNLQGLGYQQQFNPHSHVHQLSVTGYESGDTSATMTPTSLSRPGSPSSAGQVGPNKKRKSATFHRKVPSGLTMTPRVDTSQAHVSNLPSAVSMGSQFSPGFSGGPMNQPYMTMPNNSGAGNYFGSGPPTPSDTGPFQFSQPQVDVSRMNNQAYFSHPSSTVPSRASSPVLQQTRGNMAAYARQQPVQTTTNTINPRPVAFPGQISGTNLESPASGPFPVITRITPAEGPVTGGNEVAIFGDNFVLGVSVSFGEHSVPTQFISTTSLIVTAPPGRAGPVNLNLDPPGAQHGQFSRYPDTTHRPTYRYVQYSEEMMVMALKYLSEQQLGNSDAWQNLAHSSANGFVQMRASRAGMPSQGIPPGHRMAISPADATVLAGFARCWRDGRGDLSRAQLRRCLYSADRNTSDSLPLTRTDSCGSPAAARGETTLAADCCVRGQRTPASTASQMQALCEKLASMSIPACIGPQRDHDVIWDRHAGECEHIRHDGATRSGTKESLADGTTVCASGDTIQSSPTCSATAFPTNIADTMTIAALLANSPFLSAFSATRPSPPRPPLPCLSTSNGFAYPHYRPWEAPTAIAAC